MSKFVRHIWFWEESYNLTAKSLPVLKIWSLNTDMHLYWKQITMKLHLQSFIRIRVFQLLCLDNSLLSRTWAFIIDCSPVCSTAESWGTTAICCYFLTVFVWYRDAEHRDYRPSHTEAGTRVQCSVVLRSAVSAS